MIRYFNNIYSFLFGPFYHLPNECLVPPNIFNSVTLLKLPVSSQLQTTG